MLGPTARLLLSWMLTYGMLGHVRLMGNKTGIQLDLILSKKKKKKKKQHQIVNAFYLTR